MSAFAAVFVREVRERWLVPVVALVLGGVPMLLPILPWTRTPDPRGLRDASALFLAVALAVFLSLALGASMLVRDLAEGRLGFYLSRPIGSQALWLGKVGAVLALVLGAGLLVTVPATLAGGGLRALRDVEAFFWPPGPWALVALAALFLFTLLLAHAAALAFRSRSPWVMLDVMSALVASAFVWRFGGTLYEEGALGALTRGGWALLLAAAAALLVAGERQLSQGRSDLRRRHAVLSIWLWSAVVVGVSAFGGWSWWVLHPAPADLLAVHSMRLAPQGGWLTLAGPVRGRAGHHGSFLLDAASGEFLSLGGAWRNRSPAFSADGTTGAWLHTTGGRQAPEAARAMIARRGSDGFALEASQIAFPCRPVSLALSPDGMLLGAVEACTDRLTVSDIGTGRLLASVVVRSRNPWEIRFLSPRRLVLSVDASIYFERRVSLWALEPMPGPQGEVLGLRELTDLQAELLGVWPRLPGQSADVVLREMSGAVRALDGDTGELREELVEPGRPELARCQALKGGRLVITLGGVDGQGEGLLRLVSPEGERLRELALPGQGLWLPSGEASPGLLTLARWHPKSVRRELWKIVHQPWTQEPWLSLSQIDLGSGALRAVGEAAVLRPLAMGAEVDPGTPLSLLLRGPGPRISRLDPQAGTVTATQLARVDG